MDEVFGKHNRLSTISYAATSGSSAKTLPETANYLLWYAERTKSVIARGLEARPPRLRSSWSSAPSPTRTWSCFSPKRFARLLSKHGRGELHALR